MANAETLPRSPLLMSQHDTVLLVVDVQEKLVPLLPQSELLVDNIERLLQGAQLLQLPRLATEQYPKGLGPTVGALRSQLGEIAEKLTFSCAGCPPLVDALRRIGRPKILVAGIETHVCVLQTVFDLLTEGYQVYVAADAVAARGLQDHQLALRRMESAGVTLASTEGALFEWCERAGSDRFKQLSQLVRRTGTPPPTPAAPGGSP